MSCALLTLHNFQAVADLHGCSELHGQALSYIETHFTEVLDCDEFIQLGPDAVVDLIKSDTITVPSEEKVKQMMSIFL